mmetsp:Transcript_40027/g.52690  ORF Transcript_40027/g.52690 Transcript_40027/m.52690 type:complete len:230 (+) Transcript_40027:258-947(+)
MLLDLPVFSGIAAVGTSSALHFAVSLSKESCTDAFTGDSTGILSISSIPPMLSIEDISPKLCGADSVVTGLGFDMRELRRGLMSSSESSSLEKSKSLTGWEDPKILLLIPSDFVTFLSLSSLDSSLENLRGFVASSDFSSLIKLTGFGPSSSSNELSNSLSEAMGFGCSPTSSVLSTPTPGLQTGSINFACFCEGTFSNSSSPILERSSSLSSSKFIVPTVAFLTGIVS